MWEEDYRFSLLLYYRVICGLSVPSQHLLVLLFGTFRMVSDSADSFGTRMSPEAIGISVAPSLFHTCIHDGQRVRSIIIISDNNHCLFKAKLEDVVRFRLASDVVAKIIRGFGYTNLFPRSCYEFYAKITGRTLRVDENWLFTFQYPASKPTQLLLNYYSEAISFELNVVDCFTNCEPFSIQRSY